MRIFKRLSDIIVSSVNDLLDRAEDPRKMLKQILREMEEGIGAAKRVALQALTAEKKLKKELDQNLLLAAEWQKKALQALGARREDLARKAIARRLEVENLVGTLKAQHESALQSVEQMKGTLKALQARFAEAKRRETALLSRKTFADAKKALLTKMERIRFRGDGLSESPTLGRVEESVAQAEGEAEALKEIADDGLGVDEQGSEEAVEAELRKLKERRKDKKA